MKIFYSFTFSFPAFLSLPSLAAGKHTHTHTLTHTRTHRTSTATRKCSAMAFWSAAAAALRGLGRRGPEAPSKLESLAVDVTDRWPAPTPAPALRCPPVAASSLFLPIFISALLLASFTMV